MASYANGIIMKKIRSKKNNLFNYFACDHKDLSSGYLKSCAKFFRSIKQRKEKNENNISRSKGLGK